MKLLPKFFQIVELEYEEKDFDKDSRDTCHDLAVQFKKRIERQGCAGMMVYVDLGLENYENTFVTLTSRNTEEEIYNKIRLLIDDT